ncbi:kinase-like domain-containing protein [Aspergillus karnatakaensis]|uniref:kinase-like domain-containing protein n=1 Tax=Aspergillus karnatakaensis TaxID=1810916 RepID=UPI003CCD60B9
MRNGNLRDYIRINHAQLDDQIKETWVQSAIRAVDFIHRFSVVYGDISARNFLVADDLSIKLCDFAGSGIGDAPAFISEGDRYRKALDEPRSVQTDLFALGCLIFEIVVGERPYEEIGDEDWEVVEGTTNVYIAAHEILLDIETAA